MTKKEYEKLHPKGCPFKKGDILTTLSKSEHREKTGLVEKYIHGGESLEGCGFGTSGWEVTHVGRPEEQRRNYSTAMSVKSPDRSMSFSMEDMEFKEFYTRGVSNPEELTEYEIC